MSKFDLATVLLKVSGLMLIIHSLPHVVYQVFNAVLQIGFDAPSQVVRHAISSIALSVSSSVIIIAIGIWMVSRTCWFLDKLGIDQAE